MRWDSAVYSTIMVYTLRVRRLQIYIQEEVDDALDCEALRRGVSKAALVRESVARYLAAGEHPAHDPLDDLVGASDAMPGDIDDVIYGT